MAERQEYYIGLDIGGTKCAVTLGKFTGNEETELTIVDKVKFPTNPEEAVNGKRKPTEVLEEFAKQTRILLENNNGVPKRIGVSCGGPLDSRRGIVLSRICRDGTILKLLNILTKYSVWSVCYRTTRMHVLLRNGCSVQERGHRI